MVLYETFSQGGFWSTQNQARFYMAGSSTSHRLERPFRMDGEFGPDSDHGNVKAFGG